MVGIKYEQGMNEQGLNGVKGRDINTEKGICTFGADVSTSIPFGTSSFMLCLYQICRKGFLGTKFSQEIVFKPSGCHEKLVLSCIPRDYFFPFLVGGNQTGP